MASSIFGNKVYGFTLQTFLALALMFGCGAPVAANDDTAWRFDGFATIGAVRSSERNADFVTNFTRPAGAGYSKKWSADVDSKFGAQLSAGFDNGFSAVLQLVSEQNWDNTYTPHVEWANVKYAFNPDLSVRIGRATTPAYLLADVRKVGYSIPWVRAPFLYSLVPPSNTDGIDGSYRFAVGNASNTVTGKIGSKYSFKAPSDGPAGNKFTADSYYAASDKLEIGDLALQLNYLTARLTVSSIVAIPVPEFSKLADDVLFTYRGGGFSYDTGKYFLMGEAGRSNAPFFGTRQGWYVSGGYRIEKVTPYVTYENYKQPKSSPIAGSTIFSTLAMGVRWDLLKNASFKLQYDRMNLDKNSSGPLENIQPNFSSGKVNLISAVADLVF